MLRHSSFRWAGPKRSIEPYFARVTSQSRSQTAPKGKRDHRKQLKGLVGASRFELETSCAQGRRATRLRYAPTRGMILPQFGQYRKARDQFAHGVPSMTPQVFLALVEFRKSLSHVRYIKHRVITE